VTIVDLPAGTTVSGLELFEAVQTVSGIGQSVQLSLSQMMAVWDRQSRQKSLNRVWLNAV
jgi:hypothetical protein